MAIKFRTDDPQALLAAFKKHIDQKEPKGKIDTWEVWNGGFRHTSQNWKEKGLFKASISDDRQYLVFAMEKFADDFSFAYYHGHLLQSFIQHLNPHFSFSRYFDGRKKKGK